MNYYRNTPEKFWTLVDQTNHCWLWKGTDHGDGYGQFGMCKTRRYAHHWSYILTHNLDYNTKLYLCHTCDTPSCVNPNHLYEGSDTTNARDMMRRGRGRGQFTKDSPTVFKKGCIPASRQLDETTAFNIKKDLLTLRQCDVINKYNVSRETVRGIVRGSSWAWLEVS